MDMKETVGSGRGEIEIGTEEGEEVIQGVGVEIAKIMVGTTERDMLGVA